MISIDSISRIYSCFIGTFGIFLSTVRIIGSMVAVCVDRLVNR